MSYEVIPTDNFKTQAKRLTKKYQSLKMELFELTKELESNPFIGIPLGNNCYKIKLAIKSKSKGKSGGVRIISYSVNQDNDLYLLTIYDKSEISSISKNDLSDLIHRIIK